VLVKSPVSQQSQHNLFLRLCNYLSHVEVGDHALRVCSAGQYNHQVIVYVCLKAISVNKGSNHSIGN